MYRLFGRDTNKAIADLICLEDEVIDDSGTLTITHPVERWKTKEVVNFYAKELYVDVFVDGKLVYQPKTVQQLAENCQQNLQGFWEEYLRLTRPHQYKVDLSEKLYQLKQSLILAERGAKN